MVDDVTVDSEMDVVASLISKNICPVFWRKLIGIKCVFTFIRVSIHAL